MAPTTTGNGDNNSSGDNDQKSDTMRILESQGEGSGDQDNEAGWATVW
jgi:hypothetical protein